MDRKFTLTNDEIRELSGFKKLELQKYASFFINWANRWSQGTRPKVVGQMTDLIQDFSGRTKDEWKEWYLEQYPDAIEKSTIIIEGMIENFKDSLNKIDRDIIREWVKDFVFVKTFIGLKFQEAILIKASKILNKKYRLSTPEEESKGIDGFLDNIPISIKPDTYKTQVGMREKIEATLIFYNKDDNGINVDISNLL